MGKDRTKDFKRLQKGDRVRVKETMFDPYYRGMQGVVTQLKDNNKVIVSRQFIFDSEDLEIIK